MGNPGHAVSVTVTPRAGHRQSIGVTTATDAGTGVGMPRAKAAEPPAEKAAEKPKTKAPPHPLFPTVDATTIHSLWLYRLVKPHPKARAVPERLARFEPQELTSDMQLEAYGGGVFRVTAVGAAGHLVGFPYEVRVRDQMGRVPELVSDFEEERAPGLAAPGGGEEVARMYASLVDKIQADNKRQREEERAAAEQNFTAFGALVDKVINAMGAINAAHAPAQLPAASMEPPQWFRRELDELRKSREEDRKKRHELELELARMKAKREAGDGGRKRGGGLEIADLVALAPIVKEFFKSEAPSSPAPVSRDAGGGEAVVETVEVDGVRLPSLASLRALIQANAERAARGEPRDFFSADALAQVAAVRDRLGADYLAAVEQLTEPT